MKENKSYIVKISTMKDLDYITEDTKYINIDISNCDNEIINFFLKNGEKYLYSEIIDNQMGYIYVNYTDFYKAENIINGIYANMPNDLTKLEIARYLYTELPKYVFFDINLNREKNETSNLSLINTINNIWGSISAGRINDMSISKIYYYLCKRIGIDITIIKNNNDLYNEIMIDKIKIITDLYNDIPYIQAKMKTKFFGTYNEEIELDKKINYINNKYNDELIDKALKNIDYNKEDCIENILLETEKIFNIKKIKPAELSIIYNQIFKKYCPNYIININNLFLNNKNKNHFIIITCNNKYYSFNYKKNTFVEVDNYEIKKNIEIGKIGLYLNEFIPNINN